MPGLWRKVRPADVPDNLYSFDKDVVGADGVSKTDRLLDFSTALSSAIYFVPSLDALSKMHVSPADPG